MNDGNTPITIEIPIGSDDLEMLDWLVRAKEIKKVQWVFEANTGEEIHCNFVKGREKMKKSKATYIVDAGKYESDTLIGLCIEVLKHRLWHLVKHGRWVD